MDDTRGQDKMVVPHGKSHYAFPTSPRSLQQGCPRPSPPLNNAQQAGYTEASYFPKSRRPRWTPAAQAGAGVGPARASQRVAVRERELGGQKVPEVGPRAVREGSIGWQSRCWTQWCVSTGPTAHGEGPGGALEGAASQARQWGRDSAEGPQAKEVPRVGLGQELGIRGTPVLGTLPGAQDRLRADRWLDGRTDGSLCSG